MKLEQLWRVVVVLSVAVEAQYGSIQLSPQGFPGRGSSSSRAAMAAAAAAAAAAAEAEVDAKLPPNRWGTAGTATNREPSCVELRAMWRHTSRIIRYAAENAKIKHLPSFVNTLEYAYAPKFLQFWHATPPRHGQKASLPYGRVLFTKTKSKRPPPNALSLIAENKYQVLPRQKTPRNVGLGGIGYFNEDDEGGDLVFQDPTAEIDAVPREEDFGRYGTIVRSPEEKAKLRREFLLTTANRLGKGVSPYDALGLKTKLELCREKVENAPCRSNADCFCTMTIHPYTCHETLDVCTRRGGMQVLRDTYGRWHQRPFDARELGYNDEVANDL